MGRYLVFACMLAVPLPASGQAMKPAGKIDYQKKVGAGFWEPHLEVVDRFGLSEGYRLKFITSENDTWKNAVVKDGQVLYTWDFYSPTGFIRRGVVYHPLFTRASGCDVAAYDLEGRRELWRSRLKGIGFDPQHSLYWNEVAVRPFDEQTLIVFGEETLGRYIEIVDLKTGETVGHRLLPVPKVK
jgi:hypothetical protein